MLRSGPEQHLLELKDAEAQLLPPDSHLARLLASFNAQLSECDDPGHVLK
jgi:hypothetical protein